MNKILFNINLNICFNKQSGVAYNATMDNLASGGALQRMILRTVTGDVVEKTKTRLLELSKNINVRLPSKKIAQTKRGHCYLSASIQNDPLAFEHIQL